MIGIVSRLTRQKGFDVVVEGLHRMLQEDVQIVLLGTGDPGLNKPSHGLVKYSQINYLPILPLMSS